ncbi:restriction endonuclease subunit S [Streptomyces sp. W16]|uniref:restriction endonuclease subunit S n=1 Tax=Streptomyces sp. W16 TaxID=3076631 RepID=UPI00295B3B7E|nr:restriction endonuclease subunit S [Streptomyces sp. W16]MDV9170519.1 restriction endonuclease subunit S [Streptomyces sp. W16]
MSNWETMTIGQLGRVVTGATPRTGDNRAWGDQVDFVTPTEMSYSDRAPSGCRQLSEDGLNTMRRRLVPAGSVLFACIGFSTGKVARTSRPAVTNQQINTLIPDSSVVDSGFAYYMLRYRAVDIRRIASGSTTPIVNKSTFAAFSISVPGLPEQASIAEVLGGLDDKIAINERITSTAENLCRAIFSDQSWAVRTSVEGIATLRKEQVTPATLTELNVAHYSLPAFDSGAMPEIAEPRSIKSAKYLIRQPSVLFSKLNPEIPRVWNVSPDQGISALASTEFLVLEPRNGVSTAELWAVLSQPGLLGGLVAKVTGTSKSHQRVQPSEVMNSAVVDPRELGDTRGHVRALVDRAMQARRESRVLATLRDALLPQLMSGKLRIRDAERIVEDTV